MGLSVHHRKAHTENVPERRKKARWDRKGLLLLAREEPCAEAEGVSEMNKHLHSLFPCRTYGSIKSQWRVSTVRYHQILSTPRTEQQALNTGSLSVDATSSVAEGTQAIPGMHDDALSLPFSHEDLATELPGTQETDDGAGEWARKLRDVLDGVELDLQGIGLEEIEPGLPSDQVRKALDDGYMAWLPPLVRRQSALHTGPSQTRAQGCPSQAQGTPCPGAVGVSEELISLCPECYLRHLARPASLASYEYAGTILESVV